MNANLLRRLAEALKAHTDRESEPYVFFKLIGSNDSPHFFLLETGVAMSFDEFFEYASASMDTIFVPMPDQEEDEEEIAFWKEQDAKALTWAEIQEENAWTGTAEDLIAKREADRALIPVTDEIIERRQKAERYERRAELWSPLLHEMGRRVLKRHAQQAL